MSAANSKPQAPLVLVSNRGPVTFDVDGSFTRGGGGLVTALTGLATHRDAVWIASAMTEGDARTSRERGGRAFSVDTPAGEFEVRLVVSEPDAYDRFYNVVANPMLWFIQHYLWDLSNAPDIRENEVRAWEEGYKDVRPCRADDGRQRVRQASGCVHGMWMKWCRPRAGRHRHDRVLLALETSCAASRRSTSSSTSTPSSART